MEPNAPRESVNRRVEQGVATRATLIAVARRLFTEKGYAATSTEEIVQTAAVTRGALYYHFTDKEDLFKAVFETLEAEFLERVLAASATAATPLERLKVGLDAFLKLCLDREIQQIVLQEGPAALGWQTWHEIDARYTFGAMQVALEAAMDSGELDRQDPEALAHAMVGALMQAGMVVARAPDPRQAQRAMGGALQRVVEGLRPIDAQRSQPKTAEPKTAEPRTAEPKTAESAEAKTAEPKTAELAEAKTAKTAKTAEPRTAEAKTAKTAQALSGDVKKRSSRNRRP